MSADNWGMCPKCVNDQEKWIEEARLKLVTQYGKIPANEYILKAKELEVCPELKDTLREDFEVYIDAGGSFNVSYTASCQVCGFSFTHRHEQAAYPVK